MPVTSSAPLPIPLPHPPRATLHDALLLLAIALSDVVSTLFFASDPSIGPSRAGSMATFFLGTSMLSLASGSLLLIAARRWVARTAGWSTRLSVAAAVLVALAGLRGGAWLFEPGLPTLVQALGIAIPVGAFAVVWAYTGLIVGALVMVYEAFRRRRDDAMHRLLALQRAQREAEHRVALQRLWALQGRIDPQLLSRMMAAVGLTYRQDPAKAETLLDGLIAFLRLMTAHSRQRVQTLGQELALAGASQRVRALCGMPALTLDTRAAEAAGDAPFPAAALLALLDGMLALERHAVPPVVLQATRRGGRLRLMCEVPLALPEAALARARALVEQAGGTLTDRADGPVRQLTMEIPDEDV